MFKRMLQAFGIGGPTVDTVLRTSSCQPGGQLAGEVRLTGGNSTAQITHITLSLITRMETESYGDESVRTVEFYRLPVSGNIELQAGESRNIPFELTLPWETPITAIGAAQLRGMSVGVQTEVAMAGAVDKGDLDLVAVHPLPAQEAVLEAFGRLGFRFHSADVERGHIHGLHQELPFYQEIEFLPPGTYAGKINEVELTFVANPSGLAVVLEADKRGGFFSAEGDTFGRFQYSHLEAERADWVVLLESWLAQVAGRRAQHGYHGHPHSRHHDDDHGGGIGVGGLVAAGAAGVVGGMVMDEVIDEAGDFFFGDDEE